MMEIHFLTDSGRPVVLCMFLKITKLKLPELITAIKSGELKWSNLVSGVNRGEGGIRLL